MERKNLCSATHASEGLTLAFSVVPFTWGKRCVGPRGQDPRISYQHGPELTSKARMRPFPESVRQVCVLCIQWVVRGQLPLEIWTGLGCVICSIDFMCGRPLTMQVRVGLEREGKLGHGLWIGEWSGDGWWLLPHCHVPAWKDSENSKLKFPFYLIRKVGLSK